MKKVIFSTTIGSAGTGIMCNEDFTEPYFVAVNYAHGSANYSYYLNGSATSNGRSCTSATEAWEELAEYLGCDKVLPVGQPQIKKWFKEVYKEKSEEFKYNNSQAAREATEQNKIKRKTQSGGLWLKSGRGKGFWN